MTTFVSQSNSRLWKVRKILVVHEKITGVCKNRANNFFFNANNYLASGI